MWDRGLSYGTLRGWLLAAALGACAPLLAQTPSDARTGAVGVEVARLADADAPVAQVLAGARDAQFAAAAEHEPVIYERTRAPVWWRVRALRDLAVAERPQLLLDGPYLTRVEAWVPGGDRPTRHAIYGPDVDTRYAPRALVIALPQGLPQGEAVYLRVTAPAAVPMMVSVQPRDQVHRDDLAYVAWRTLILGTLVILLLLALSFWAGVGERSFVYLAVTLGSGALYLAASGGEVQGVPLLGWMFGHSPQPVRVVACVGVIASNYFMSMYLELGRHAPRLDRVLRVLAATMGAMAVANALLEARFLAGAGNLVLVLSSLAVFAAAVVTSLQGSRAARFLLVSWLPLIVTCILKALQLGGLIVGAPWFTHALAGSFALAGLILTIGLSDKLLQLRRDRDLASRQASIDGLTGLLNRHAIEHGLAEAVAAAKAARRPMCVAFVDIDHFKAINDTHGHHAGDCCLRFIAQRLRNQLRERDLLARYGGDELLVVMPDTNLEDGLARADAALYASKASGRNHVSGAAAPLLQQATT